MAAATGQRCPPAQRNKVKTRAHVINAAKTLLARDGMQGFSLAKAAREASVNRSTAYEHFESREKLVAATLDAVSQELQDLFFARLPVGQTQASLNLDGKDALDGLALYFVQNARLAAIWLDDLTKRRRQHDPLIRGWIRAIEAFTASGASRPGIDAEVLAVSLIGTYLIWPLWSGAEELSHDAQRDVALRLSNELIRHGLYGGMRPEGVPKLADRLAMSGSSGSSSVGLFSDDD